MMKTLPLTASLLFLTYLPTMAEIPMALPSGQQAAPLQPQTETPQQRPVEAEADSSEPQQARQEQLSEAEQRIRIGIVMLGRLHDLLAHIKDEQTAEAAVAPVMRASAEFRSWAQGFSSLTPLDIDTQRLYERRYLPVIEELNSRLRIQGERLASAEFYGSQNLPAALVRLVTSMQ